jgi:hypothetical protein
MDPWAGTPGIVYRDAPGSNNRHPVHGVKVEDGRLSRSLLLASIFAASISPAGMPARPAGKNSSRCFSHLGWILSEVTIPDATAGVFFLASGPEVCSYCRHVRQ